MKKQFFLNIVLAILFIISSKVQAQYGDKYFSLALYYDYTVTSRLYENPRDADLILRQLYHNIDGLKGFTVDLRYRISEEVFLNLSTGYTKSPIVFNPVDGISQSGAVTLRAEDSFVLYPIELSVVYLLPISTEQFKFFMGGGAGLYFGSINRTINEASVKTIEREIDLGIHVLAGMDYLINDFVGVRGQMKFRDPEFEIKSEYDRPSVIIDDETVVIRRNSFWSKVNVDGIVFSLGVILLF